MDSFKRIMLRNGLSLRITFLISLTRDPRTPWLQSKLQCERGQQFESNHICRLFNHHPPITREDSSTRPPIPPISESIYLKSSSAPWLCLGTYLCTTATIYWAVGSPANVDEDPCIQHHMYSWMKSISKRYLLSVVSNCAHETREVVLGTW